VHSPAPDGPASVPAMAAVVDRLLWLGGRLQALAAEVAASHGLTGQQAVLIRALDQPKPMRAVAAHLRCDPSNVTGLIDRIERRGLVERATDPADRRIRLLALTAGGRKVRDGLLAELVTQVTAATTLTHAEAADLVVLLDRIDLGGRPGPCV
jgi:DNA-binding MarR family transcriptional regulator